MISFGSTRRLLSSTILSASLAASLNAAHAQTAAPVADAGVAPGLIDIVVSPERRPQPLQTAPLAITAFVEDQLVARGITSTLKVAQYVPNMLGFNAPGLGSANAYYIRGLGSSATFPGANAPVGTFVDDVNIGWPGATNFGFFDVDRVEVLRGPQGTLLGRNTSGGAVNVVLNLPADRFGGYAELAKGKYGKWVGRASVDIPYSENFAIKLSGYYQNDDGHVTNSTTGEDVNDTDMSGLRGALRLDVGDHVKWNAALAYMDNAGDNLANATCDPANPSNCGGRFSTTGLLQNWPVGGTYAPYAPATISGAKADYRLGNVTKTMLLTSNLQWVGEVATLSLITGVVDSKLDSSVDLADGRGVPSALDPYPEVHGYPSGGYTVANQGKVNQFSQDVKLDGKLLGGRLDYVVGAYFFHDTNNADVADIFNAGPVLGTPGNIGTPIVLADRIVDTTTDSTALYGQLDFQATAKLTLTGGLRWTDESADFSVRDNRPLCVNTPNPPASCLSTANMVAGGTMIPTSQNTRQWSPKFVASWQQDPNLMVYASATNGFTSGGWNAFGTTNASLLPYAPETAWNYELGMKSQWFDNRLRANLTTFYLDASNVQSSSSAVAADGMPTFATQTAAGMRNKGVELELTAAPMQRLNLTASVGYQNAKYAVDSGAPDFNSYGVMSIAYQQQQCLAQLAAGRIPLGAGASNAPSCATGIVDASGNIAQPVNTPTWSGTIGGTYDFPIPAAGIILSPTVNLVYRSALETGSGNGTIWTGSTTSGFNGQVYPANPFGGSFIAGSHTGAATQVNAQLAMTTDDNHWLVAIECENCFNTSYSQASWLNYNYYNPPVTWTIRAKRTF
jgi:iron complex outermembrane recepter protein